jgi:chromosome segregation protein
MRLKKLQLFGFKSFADRTEVLFDEGVTCVVGPNGCGKSNISDAIRWVLGERSAKLLRGSKMEDVIFNGTDYRKPLAFAEVSLTIDNSDRGLPIEYQEVTLTRRLYRSGESEYLLNRTSCRLKDIQDLILDTGIGSNAYSMIEQGRIDYILNADAEERRSLIEAAAGISKYKVKKEEAIRKLERTEENLVRLNDIVQEIHKNIQYAERQARRAERYKQQFEQLKDLEIRKAFFDLARLGGEKAGLNERLSENQSRLGRKESERHQCRMRLEKFEKTLQEILGRYSVEESRRYALRSQMEQAEQELRFHQEKRMELATRRGENRQEESQLVESLKKNRVDLGLKKQELESFAIEKQKVLEQLTASESVLKATEEQWEASKSLFDKSKIGLFEIASEIAKLKNEFYSVAAFLETSDEQKRKLKTHCQRFQREKGEWQARGQSYDQEMIVLQEKLAMLERRKEELEIQQKDLAIHIEEEERRKHQTERLLHEKMTRLSLLKELDRASGCDPEALLQEAPGLETHLIRGMRDIVSVQKGYEWALEAALGFFSHALISYDLKAAEKLLSHLVQKKNFSLGILIGNGLFSPKASAQASAQIEMSESRFIECSLLEVVDIQEGYRNLLGPFLENIFVIDSFEPSDLGELLSLARDCRLVTKEGICLGPGPKIFFRHGLNLEEGSFQRASEMKDLERQIAEFQSSCASISSVLQELENRFKDSESQWKSVGTEDMDCKIQKEANESLRKGLQDRLASYEQEMDLLMRELEELQSAQQKALEKKESLEQEIGQMQEKERAMQEAQEALLKQMETQDRKRSQALKEVTEWRGRFQHLEDREALFEEAVRLLTENQRRDSNRLASLSEEYQRICEKEENLQGQDGKLHEKQKQLDEEMRETEIALGLIRQEKEKMEGDIAKEQKAMQDLTHEQQALQEGLHQIEMKIMGLGYQEKAVAERIEQAYHVKVADLNPGDYSMEDRSAEDLEAGISQLRERVQSLGTVNLLAIEEYEELKKRYDFLISQQQDMNEARESLMEAIRQINRTTKSLFEETFANVQKTFQEYYQTLFRGGEARLVLIDESHPLESGIDIVVRPAGKKLQHLSLLSGGEKALTAIALLFALFKIKPSPFCVLDEVDAPLDEANIDRFLTVLRTFLEVSQFIIVTHNRKTIAMGDSLYGVTMEEAGVSKLVSVKVRPVEESISEVPQESLRADIEDPMVA